MRGRFEFGVDWMVWGLVWVWKGGVYGYDYEINIIYLKISICIFFFLGIKV